LYLYDDYTIATTSVTITKNIKTLALTTQFGYPPVPPFDSTIVNHYGRIYYTDGALLYYTEPQRYGLQRANSFMPFDSDIQTVVSCPGVLYIGTQTAIYKINNIDGDTAPGNEPLQACGSVKWSECYDPDGISAYFMSHRGFIRATPEGLEELSYELVAMPFYAAGSMTVTELDGLKYLTFIGTGGTKNLLANAEWNTVDWGVTSTQDSGWAINLTTNAVSKYEGYNFTNLSNGYACGTDGISSLSGNADNGAAINGFVQTGKTDFTNLARVTDAYLSVDGGKLALTATTDNGWVTYKTRMTTELETLKVNMAHGAKGRYWQFKIANSSGSRVVLTDIDLTVQILNRRV
jgi:hypothetical protein